MGKKRKGSFAKKLVSMLGIICLLSQSVLPAAAETGEGSPEVSASGSSLTKVYLNGAVEESGDGTTADTAVKTLLEAYEKLDSAKSMEENVIVVCGETTLSADTAVNLPETAATITGKDGETDYQSALRNGTGTIILNADTRFADIQLECGKIANRLHKTVLDITGKVGSAEGCDVEVSGGTYTNVYVYSGSGTGSASILGGQVTNLAAANGGKFDSLNLEISGGSVMEIQAGGRWTGATIDLVNIVLSGAPVIRNLNGKGACTACSETRLLFAGFNGTISGTVSNVDKVGVSAVGGNTSAAASDVAAAFEMAGQIGNLSEILLCADVNLDDQEIFNSVNNITLKGDLEEAARKVFFSEAQYVCDNFASFENVTLQFSEDAANPTILSCTDQKPDFSTFSNVKTAGYYKIRSLNDSGKIYLSPDGSDDNDGTTKATAVATLEKAYELLDETEGADANVIVVCGEITVNASSMLNLPAKAATITGKDAETQYQAVLKSGTGAIILNEDTKFTDIQLDFSKIVNRNHKIVLDITGKVASAEGCEVQVSGGTYTNVYIYPGSGTGSIRILGGQITNLAAANGGKFDSLNLEISGGSIMEIQAGGRWSGATIDTVNILLSAAPVIRNLNGRGACTDCTETRLLFAGFNGTISGTVSNVDEVGVTAVGENTKAAAADIVTAFEVAKTIGNLSEILLCADVNLDNPEIFNSVNNITLKGDLEEAARKVVFSEVEYACENLASFENVTLQFSEDAANPTLLTYEEQEPDFTAFASVKTAGYYKTRSLKASTKVYLSTDGNDENSGKTAAEAVATLEKAYELLDETEGADANVIVVCGEITVNASSMLNLPAKAATITGKDGETDYQAVLKNGTGTLSLNGDTKFTDIKLDCGKIANRIHKMVLDVTGTVVSAEGCDVEVLGGSYTNVYVYPGNGTGSARISGGLVTYLAAANAGKFENLNLEISGGGITEVLAGGRWSGATIAKVNVTLKGAPVITSLDGRGACKACAETWLNFCDYTGDFGFTTTEFDHIGVIAAEGENYASPASLQAAMKACSGGGTVTIRNDIIMDRTDFAVANEAPVMIEGESEEIELRFTKDYFLFTGEIAFNRITLQFSDTETEKTKLFYDAAKGKPDFEGNETVTVKGYYDFQEISTTGSSMEVDFGEKLTKQENEGFAEITGSTVYERFQEAISYLPEEVPVLSLYDTTPGTYKNKIYVSADGSDADGDGSFENPYATPEKALVAVAEISVLERANGVAVYFRKGSYAISDTLTINIGVTDILNGTPLILAAYNNEEVNFVGGATVSGSQFKLADEATIGSEDWARLEDSVKGKVYVADLKALGISKYFVFKENKNGGTPILSMNDSQLTLARYPDVGEVQFKSVIDSGIGGGSCYEMLDKEPLTWKNTGNLYVRGSFYAEWAKAVGRIVKIDPENNSITTNAYLGWGGRELQPLYNNLHYYYNVFEELTIPGEWYLDEATGLLYIYPPSGSITDSDEIRLSTTGAEYLMEIKGAKNVLISGITFENGLGGVNIENSENVVLQQTVIRDVSSFGLRIYESYKCGAIYSTICRTGYGAFYTEVSASSYKEMKISRCFMQNSLIYETDVSAVSIRGVGDIFSHNTIHHTRSMGVGVQGTENILEYNELTSQSYDQADAGAFYFATLGANTGNVVRYNYIHDSNEPGTVHARGIYMDDATCGNYAYGNIIENMEYGIFVHCGDDNVYEDNVVINCSYPITIPDSYVNSTLHPLTGGTYRYANDAINWYNTLDTEEKADWDAHFPGYAEMIERDLAGSSQYDAGETRGDAVLYATTATGNVLKDNTIINGSSARVDTEAAKYTVTEGEVLLSQKTYTDYTTGSSVYQKIGFTDSSIVPGDELPMSAAPSLLAPVQDEEISASKVNFKWQPVKGTSYYTLTIAKDENFTNDVRSYTTILTEYSVALPGYQQDYYWKVEAVSKAKYNYQQQMISATGHFSFTLAGDYNSTDVLHYTAKVDGKKDTAYDSSARIVLGSLLGSWPSGYSTPNGDTTATGNLTWDEENLYVFLEVKKEGIYSNPLLDAYKEAGQLDLYHGFMRFEDCIEIHFKTAGTVQYKVIVHADGEGYYCSLDGWDGDYKYAVIPKEDGSGYDIEFAIPFGEEMKGGDQVSFNLMADSIDGTRWEDYLAIAQEYGIDKEYPAASDKRAIRATPVYQYRNADNQAITYMLLDDGWTENYYVLHATPVIDGEEDAAYEYSAGTKLGSLHYAIPYGDTEEIETTGELKMLWDNDYLYYYIDVTTNGIFSNPLLDAYREKDVTKWRGFIRFEDCVQLMLKTANGVSHTTTIHGDGEGYLNSYANVTEADYVVRAKEDGSGYIIEAAVPWNDNYIDKDQIIQMHFNVNSIDGNGADPVVEGKTKWEVYSEIAQEYGIDKPYNNAEAIRRVPLYQYRGVNKDYESFALSGEEYTAPAFKVTIQTTPADAAVVVQKGDTVIAPQQDGSYKLEEGDYTYTVTADGYQPAEKVAFTVKGVKEIYVTLVPEESKGDSGDEGGQGGSQEDPQDESSQEASGNAETADGLNGTGKSPKTGDLKKPLAITAGMLVAVLLVVALLLAKKNREEKDEEL